MGILNGAVHCLLAGAVVVALSGSCHRTTNETEGVRVSNGAYLRPSGKGTDLQYQRQWLRCAALGGRLMASVRPEYREALARQTTRCTRRFIASIDDTIAIPRGASTLHVAGQYLDIETRGLSPHLAPKFRFRVASDVAVPWRQRMPNDDGFGVPLALLADRCETSGICDLLPPEGVFRPATAWLEAGQGDDARLKLVIADPDRHGALQLGGVSYPLASDHSAFYAWGTRNSPLKRLGVYGLLGGKEVGRRAGLYLLEDYDPAKRPLIMIHGLGGSPLSWAKLSTAVWNDPELRAKYQVWHMVYSTDAPLLVVRRRLQRYLDKAWEVLDPEGDDPGRGQMVLVGHSLGGVLARLLCADSGDILWYAAFTERPSAVAADAADMEVLLDLFRFSRYDGVSTAIFMAAPHRGSPAADSTLGRIFHRLSGRRADEIQVLQRVARANPSLIRQELRSSYFNADLNSIVTLRHAQPIRLAAESLLPASGVAFHTIAARKAGAVPEGDGIVPLSSALLEGASSTHIVEGEHDVHLNDQAIAEVVRVLRDA